MTSNKLRLIQVALSNLFSYEPSAGRCVSRCIATSILDTTDSLASCSILKRRFFFSQPHGLGNPTNSAGVALRSQGTLAYFIYLFLVRLLLIWPFAVRLTKLAVELLSSCPCRRAPLQHHLRQLQEARHHGHALEVQGVLRLRPVHAVLHEQQARPGSRLRALRDGALAAVSTDRR